MGHEPVESTEPSRRYSGRAILERADGDQPGHGDAKPSILPQYVVIYLEKQADEDPIQCLLSHGSTSPDGMGKNSAGSAQTAR